MRLTKSATGLWRSDDGDTMIENSAELLELLEGLSEGAQLTVEFTENDFDDEDDEPKPAPRRIRPCEVQICDRPQVEGSIYCQEHEEALQRRRQRRKQLLRP